MNGGCAYGPPSTIAPATDLAHADAGAHQEGVPAAAALTLLMGAAVRASGAPGRAAAVKCTYA